MGRPHRLSGMSLVRDLHEAQETLHRLGVPRPAERKTKESFVITDICLATDPSSEGREWEDETGRYKMEKVKPAWNRKDLTKKRLMKYVDGEWLDWKGKGVGARADCARANLDLIMKVNGRVCYMNFEEMNARCAYFRRTPGMNEKEHPGVLISKRDIPEYLKELSR